MKILNIGCGDNKLEGIVNIDANQAFEPDYCVDISISALPFDDECFDEVLMFHTIEHIPRFYHNHVFYEINRVLKRLGDLYISYPEFEVCSRNYLDNHKGKMEFWEATIFGRGKTKWDEHKCAMVSSRFRMYLKDFGFDDFVVKPESERESFNTALKCKKSYLISNREDIIKREVLQS
jgi:predicted SAM-dependent methyltransferase